MKMDGSGDPTSGRGGDGPGRRGGNSKQPGRRAGHISGAPQDGVRKCGIRDRKVKARIAAKKQDHRHGTASSTPAVPLHGRLPPTPPVDHASQQSSPHVLPSTTENQRRLDSPPASAVQMQRGRAWYEPRTWQAPTTPGLTATAGPSASYEDGTGEWYSAGQDEQIYPLGQASASQYIDPAPFREHGMANGLVDRVDRHGHRDGSNANRASNNLVSSSINGGSREFLIYGMENTTPNLSEYQADSSRAGPPHTRVSRSSSGQPAALPPNLHYNDI